MASLLEKIDTLIDESSDPRVRNWFLLGSPFPTLIIIALYLVTVMWILPAYMKDRKPFKLTKIIRIYNIFQIISCIVIIYKVFTAGWYQGEYSYTCAPIDYSDNPNAVKMVSAFYLVYFLKMVELIETVFFVLRKKFNQVSGLHLYHHASTFFLTYIGCKFIGGGMASMPIMVNSFIHVLMYTYYYLSSLGPGWQKALAPWKPKLTMAQMIQFVLLIMHALTALQPGCKVPRQFLLIYLPNVIVIFKMFADFYKKTYAKKSPVTEFAKNGVKKNGVQHSHKKSKTT
ncbi:unnamed protein product [Phaedon cochleariae]|uniref:Elongation of very long chain fatty acids protein n=1 Tax=Phaedon cochleariae TaxID=80249 RepID=A0A9N9S952_PHACE|nr:unnamed protein product [Phaedon cochleariae]